MSVTLLQKKVNIPVQLINQSIFDDAFASMKERFAAEMKRMEQEMTKFSVNLMQLYGQSTTMQSGVTSSQQEDLNTNWDTITQSPLVEGESGSQKLKLQFDVSSFDPTEVEVKILNDMLIVSAKHEEKVENTINFKEYNREFMLPKGCDPEAVISSLSRDGVLTVEAPLPQQLVTSKNIPAVTEQD